MKSKGVWIRRTYPLSRRSCWLLKENTQVSEFLINDLSGQNRSIRFGKPDCPVLDPGHVRPSSPDSSKDYRTYPAILPDMSGLPSKISVSCKIFANWLISSNTLDLCDRVKLLCCIKRRWIVDKESIIMDYHSIRSGAKSFLTNSWNYLKQIKIVSS